MSTTDGTITLKDGLNNDLIIKARVYDDGSKVFYHFLDDRLPAGTDRSGTITTGGVSQQVAAAQANRVSLVFTNTSDTIMYVNENGAASTTSFPVAPGASASTQTSNALNVYCAVTGKTFLATEAIRT